MSSDRNRPETRRLRAKETIGRMDGGGAARPTRWWTRGPLLLGGLVLAALTAVLGSYGLDQLGRAAGASGDPGWEFAPLVWAMIGLAALLLAGLLLILVTAALRGGTMEATASIAAGSLIALMLAAWLAGNQSDSYVLFMVVGGTAATLAVLSAVAGTVLQWKSRSE